MDQNNQQYVFREDAQGAVTIHKLVKGDALPELRARVYTVRITDPKIGTIDLCPVEQIKPPKKLYGSVLRDVDRFFRSYQSSNENVGVGLIGAKGTGKTTTVRVCIDTALQSNMPVILVQQTIAPVALKFMLSCIQQDILVCFDEFDKNYAKLNNEGDADTQSQNDLLTLFDGSSGGGKKLMMIVANDESMVSKLFINRPGRLRYRKDFNELGADIIVPYLKENLKEYSDKQVLHVLKFKSFVQEDFSFDMLQALVREINTYGGSVMENVTILFGENILTDMRNATSYLAEVTHADGRVEDAYGVESFNHDVGAMITVMFEGKGVKDIVLTDDHFQSVEDEEYRRLNYQIGDVKIRLIKSRVRARIDFGDDRSDELKRSQRTSTKVNQRLQREHGHNSILSFPVSRAAPSDDGYANDE